MKRFWSILLVLCMVTAYLPAGALAAEESSDNIAAQTVTAAWINPLYEGIITEADLPQPAQSDVMLLSDLTYHADPASAGEEILPALENRVGTIQVGYEVPVDQFTQEGLGAITEEIFAAACAHTGVPTQGDYLAWQYGGCEISASASGRNEDNTCYNAVVNLTVLYYTDADQEKTVTKQVDRLLEELNPTGTDYEKLTVVYNWICDNVDYDYEHLNNTDYKLQYTAYGALINGTSVCQGYALLLYRLALEMGIDCRVITGIGVTSRGSEGHAWNILKLGDKYYNADPTWDINYAANDHYKFYLKCGDNFDDSHIRDEKYATSAFCSAYPIGETDYDPNADTGDSGTTDTISGTCGDNLTWTLTTDGVLTIRGTGAMEDYPYANSPFAFSDIIKTVVIEEGVTSIGVCVFTNCSTLTSVTIPSTVTSIGDSAFSYCTALKEVAGCAGITAIGSNAFSGCSALESVNFPEGLESIGNYAFNACVTLTNVTIPGTVSYLGEGAFWGCCSMKELTVCEGVTDIGMLAFLECKALERVSLPDSLISIGDTAFGNCTELAEIEFPGNLETIASSAFYGCTGLKELRIPASVTSIGVSAFSGCTGINSITFEGDAPEFQTGAESLLVFTGITATACYPADNATWTEDVMQDYGGSITWVPYTDTVRGSLNGDDVVDDSDVAQLLWYTLFPESYEISGDADFTCDGTVDDADVAYLLWHTLFPDKYPL